MLHLAAYKAAASGVLDGVVTAIVFGPASAVEGRGVRRNDAYADRVHPALILGFALAVAPLALTPGTSFTLTLSYAPHGPRAVVSVIVGTAMGTFTHATLAAVGLAAVVMRSAQIYRAIQLAGAIYLIVLGISMLRAVNRKRPARFDLARGRGPLLTAYIANLLNPKAAGIYLTLAPQFIPAHNMDLTAMESLAATHVVVMALWLSCVGFTLSAVARRINVERILRGIQQAGAVVLIALGVRTSTESMA